MSEEEKKAFKAEPEVKVITFRKDTHVFDFLNSPGAAHDRGKSSSAPEPAKTNGILHTVAEDGKPVIVDNHYVLATPLRYMKRVVAIAIVFQHWVLASITYYLVYRGPVSPSWVTKAFTVLILIVYYQSWADRSEERCGNGRVMPAMQKLEWYWDLMQEWSRYEVVRLAKLDPSKQYLLGVYPHGILILSRCIFFGSVFRSLFPGLSFPRMLAASALFRLPYTRELTVTMGGVNARRSSAMRCLAEGYNVGVYPGGTGEIFITEPDSKDTTVISRSGFIKLALEHGTPIVPVMAFGEKKCLAVHKPSEPTLRAVFKWTNIPLVLIRGVFGSWVPFRVPITVVFGEPITVPLNPSPSAEEVGKIHTQFIAAERAIYDRFRDRLGVPKDERLVFIPPHLAPVIGKPRRDSDA